MLYSYVHINKYHIYLFTNPFIFFYWDINQNTYVKKNKLRICNLKQQEEDCAMSNIHWPVDVSLDAAGTAKSLAMTFSL